MNSASIVSRIWQKDASLWSDDGAVQASINQRLGWLDAFDKFQPQARRLKDWASGVYGSGDFDNVILLGMGGSSLGPEVLAEVLYENIGLPLRVIDSTCPEDILSLSDEQIARSLFISASKSGSTIETADLTEFYWQRLLQLVPSPGAHFIAITDPGSQLQSLAEERQFLDCFINPPDIGGRYSVISYFGLVPAALMGIDIERIMTRLSAAISRCQDTDAAVNVALELGQQLAAAALAGRSKLALSAHQELQALIPWIEQLVAESTGKQGVGVLPFAHYPGLSRTATPLLNYHLGYKDKAPSTSNSVDTATPHANTYELHDRYDLAAAFFEWQFATAVCAYELGINPFDEPNVAEAKAATRQFIEGGQRLALNPLQLDDIRYQGFALAGESVPQPPEASANTIQGSPISEFISAAQSSAYLAILAYCPRNQSNLEALSRLRDELSERLGIAVTVGIGPRYLHSTGQLHKGGRREGAFIVLLQHAEQSVAVAGRDYNFARLFACQADGDCQVLANHQNPTLRIALDQALATRIDDILAHLAAH